MNFLLLLSAAGLGFLAFFEPCTIATHTLYVVRTAQQTATARRRALLQLLASRTALLLLIFSTATGLAKMFGSPSWPGESAAWVLFLIASIYLASRTIYLPVPHVESFRLWPRHQNFSASLRLGLSLPACTLPLVAIVAAGCAYIARWDSTLLATIIFSIAFTLPTFVESILGLSARQRLFLDKAARLTPYLTAGLLSVGALLLWTARK